MSREIKVIDRIIGEVRTNLPDGYDFNFFITQADKMGARGVWYLQKSNKEALQKSNREALKKPISKENLKIKRRKKSA